MRRHGHDCTRSVGSEHVVGDEDWDLGVVDGIKAHDALELHARLLFVELGALKVALGCSLLLVGLHCIDVFDLAGGEPLLNQLVLRRKDHVGRPEERVATGRVDGDDVIRSRRLEVDERAGGLADPVALHLLDAVGPVKRVEILEKTLGVLGDLEHPLAHRLADDGMVAALGASVYDFLVRQNRAERGTPVHRNLGDVGEPLLVELLEDPLRPLVILRVRRVDLAVPVVGETERADLLAEAVDVLLRRDRGVSTRLDSILLGRKAKRIPTHRMQDVEALHALVAAENVRRRIALGMPDVQACARRIREHVEAVELLAGAVRVRLKGLLFEPVLLPLLLDGGEIIVAHATLRPRRVRRSILRSCQTRRWSPQRRRL